MYISLRLIQNQSVHKKLKILVITVLNVYLILNMAFYGFQRGKYVCVFIYKYVCACTQTEISIANAFFLPLPYHSNICCWLQALTDHSDFKVKGLYQILQVSTTNTHFKRGEKNLTAAKIHVGVFSLLLCLSGKF